MFKKLLVIISLLLLINHTIDYQSSQYDGVREQISYVQTNPYYVQLQTQLTPVYSYLDGVKSKTGSVYGEHVKKHVDSITEKFYQSPIYQNVKPYVSTLSRHLTVLNNYSNHYIADLSFKLIRYNFKGKFQCLQNCTLKFYRGKISPIVNFATEHAYKYGTILVEELEFFIKYSYALLEKYCHTHISPFYQASIAPHVNQIYTKYLEPPYVQYIKPVYVKHFEPIVSCVKGQVCKHYKMLKLQQALGLSRDLVSQSYKNTMGYFQEQAQQQEPSSSSSSSELQIIDEEGNQLEIISDAATQDLTLAQNLQGWKEYMDQRIYSFFSDFEAEVEEMEEAKLSKYQPQITELLQELSLTLHSDYNEINKVISIINSHEAVLENGEEVELDSMGNIIDHKISRQEFRDLLSAGKERGGDNSEKINNKLRELVSEIEIEVDNIRHTQVDTFEDFYVIAIKEYSENIMASDYASSAGSAGSSESEMSEWRAYAKVKRNLISKRDELTQFKPALLKLEKLLSEIKFTLKTFEHEQGSYYSLLRAKANIEFQTREQREREELELIERGEAAENEEEIIGTLTQTVLRIQTVGGDIEPVETAQADTVAQPETTLESQQEPETAEPVAEPVVEPVAEPVAEASTESESEPESSASSASSASSPKSKQSSKRKSKRKTHKKQQTIAMADQAEYNTVDFQSS
ncbi:hypothetical protein WICPIJ_005069 [Wickerhamomyces pijperi]|uniref:Outer spore wall assembly protein SHE10 n=1 Tax=Wickerhamomyces pijperi TaxID=599730 RepID=A0A9P8Q6F9_WICPI|nr:hypothetical protein WICPIJ_005069 [Wickerhamomyces pijperi]